MSAQSTEGAWNTPQAKQYQQHIRSKIIGYDLLYTMMLHMMDNPEHVLIVGAGGGQELLTIGSAYPQCCFSAVEPSESMLQAAEQTTKGAELKLDIAWHHCELKEANIRTQADAATCHLVLHFLESVELKRELLKGIAANMRPGAKLFLSAVMIEGNADDELLLKYWKQSMLASGVPLEDWERYRQSFGISNHPLTRTQLVHLLRDAGFISVVPYMKSYSVEGFVAVKGV